MNWFSQSPLLYRIAQLCITRIKMQYMCCHQPDTCFFCNLYNLFRLFCIWRQRLLNQQMEPFFRCVLGIFQMEFIRCTDAYRIQLLLITHPAKIGIRCTAKLFCHCTGSFPVNIRNCHQFCIRTFCHDSRMQASDQTQASHTNAQSLLYHFQSPPFILLNFNSFVLFPNLL